QERDAAEHGRNDSMRRVPSTRQQALHGFGRLRPHQRVHLSNDTRLDRTNPNTSPTTDTNTKARVPGRAAYETRGRHPSAVPCASRISFPAPMHQRATRYLPLHNNPRGRTTVWELQVRFHTEGTDGDTVKSNRRHVP